jgi:hypothetical protein
LKYFTCFISVFFNLQVPGIGKASKKILIEAGVSTTFQLLGKFLSLKGEDVGPIEHCDRFYYW